VTEDSNIAAQVATLFADAKDRLEGTAFATGSGSTQPYGIITELGLVTNSRTAANTNGVFGAVDVYNLVNNLPARHQENCSWVGHWFTANLIRQFAGANSANFWTDMNPGIPPLLLGRPFYTSSAVLNAAGAVGLSSATASNDDILVLGDFQKYLIVDRVGLEVVYNPIVIGSSALRPTGQVSWTAFWRVGARVTDAAAFQMLRV
jgi:HK97 family phage major capsid protein